MKYYNIILSLMFMCSAMTNNVQGYELKEGESFSVAWGTEGDSSYSLTLRLSKESCNPIYFVGEQYVDSERGEVLTHIEEVYLAIRSPKSGNQNTIKYPVRRGSLGRESVILVTKTIAGVDDLYAFNINKKLLFETLKSASTLDGSLIHVRLGFEVYEAFPGCLPVEEKGELFFSEPLCFEVDSDGAITLVGFESLGAFFPKEGNDLGVKFPPFGYP